MEVIITDKLSDYDQQIADAQAHEEKLVLHLRETQQALLTTREACRALQFARQEVAALLDEWRKNQSTSRTVVQQNEASQGDHEHDAEYCSLSADRLGHFYATPFAPIH